MDFLEHLEEIRTLADGVLTESRTYVSQITGQLEEAYQQIEQREHQFAQACILLEEWSASTTSGPLTADASDRLTRTNAFLADSHLGTIIGGQRHRRPEEPTNARQSGAALFVWQKGASDVKGGKTQWADGEP